jgi:hypothetical protein
MDDTMTRCRKEPLPEHVADALGRVQGIGSQLVCGLGLLALVLFSFQFLEPGQGRSAQVFAPVCVVRGLGPQMNASQPHYWPWSPLNCVTATL